METVLDYVDGPKVTTRVLTTGRQEGQKRKRGRDDRSSERQRERDIGRCTLMVLKTKSGAMSQRVWEAQEARKGNKVDSSLSLCKELSQANPS